MNDESPNPPCDPTTPLYARPSPDRFAVELYLAARAIARRSGIVHVCRLESRKPTPEEAHDLAESYSILTLAVMGLTCAFTGGTCGLEYAHSVVSGIEALQLRHEGKK